MRVLRPTDWPTALALRAEHPGATPVSGGTDVMVALRSGRLRPDALLDLSLVTDLRTRNRNSQGPNAGLAGAGGGTREVVRVGAGVTYTEIAEWFWGALPGLAAVAGVVGSRQVRNRGTLGGCLGSADPAGDPRPMLLAVGAVVEVHSVRGVRLVPVGEFSLEPDELVAAVRVPVAVGPQWFDRVGVRRGMVKSVCSCAIVVDGKRISVAVGGCGPAIRAAAAEEFVAAERGAPLGDDVVAEFGRLVAAATRPVDDVLASAVYRRHAVAVLAGRGLRTVWEGMR